MSSRHLISTADVPERDRLAFWVEAVCETLLEVKVETKAGPAFSGAIETHQVGPLSVHFIGVQDEFVTRTRQGISRSKLSAFHLAQSRHSAVRFNQLGREFDLAPGACTLIDSRHPFTIDRMTGGDMLTVAIPTDWLLTWLPAPEEALATQWAPGKGWGGVLAAALANLTPSSTADLLVAPSVLCDQLGALVAMAAADNSRPPVRIRSTLLDCLRDTLKAAYHDVALCPAEVAHHHGISLRYLHLQFAAGGTTFGAELLRIRLENAVRMLGNPRCDRLPMAEIALRCGFGNASHFARRFRERYGHSPTEQRSR